MIDNLDVDEVRDAITSLISDIKQHADVNIRDVEELESVQKGRIVLTKLASEGFF